MSESTVKGIAEREAGGLQARLMNLSSCGARRPRLLDVVGSMPSLAHLRGSRRGTGEGVGTLATTDNPESSLTGLCAATRLGAQTRP